MQEERRVDERTVGVRDGGPWKEGSRGSSAVVGRVAWTSYRGEEEGGGQEEQRGGRPSFSW